MDAKPKTEERHPHVHSWQPNGTAKDTEDYYSPVSASDHAHRSITYAIRSCECGAVRRTIVAYGAWKRGLS